MVELDCTLLDLPANLAEQYAVPLRAALAQMADVEAGVHVNMDEDLPAGRAVGHYWLRKPELANAEDRKAIVAAQEQIERFVTEARKRFSAYLLVGIGGSALGPQFLANAFREPGVTPPIFFFDNTDPEGFSRTLRDIEHAGGLKKTLTIIVSKSGGTPETRNGMLVAQHAYTNAGLDFAKHAVAVTEPGSGLEKLAAGWLARFPVWRWVGGRTSLFSPVGLLPTALLGFDWRGLLKGALEMDERTRPTRTEPAQNPSLQLALAWYHETERRGISHMVALPYSDRLSLLASYLQQLVMESLGKDGKGLTVLGNKGSTDQHSYVQQLRDGRPDFFVAFVRVLRPHADPVAMIEVEPGVTSADYLAAFQEGTAKALHEAGRGSLRVTIDEVTAANVGGIVALFERAVGYYAAMIGINAYNQPGVEAGKKAAKEILAARKK